jgi:uncharacterized protein (TIGR02268 family)
MWNLLSCRRVPLFVFLAFAARAQGHEPGVRNHYRSEEPRDAASQIHVGSGVATVLRFEQEVDPVRTRLLGWEGWFEPLLAGGRSVVLVPRQKIPPEDRFLLLVTLAGGTELPFVVTAAESGQIDQQVNVFPDSETSEAVRSRLSDARRRERLLREENERLRDEENSIDHALAALLVRGAVKMTPFQRLSTWSLPCDGTHIEVRNFTSPEKMAVVFHVKNLDPNKPWRLREARLVHESTGSAWPFALRLDHVEIAPGSSGTIAVVADVSAFDFKRGAEKLVLQLFRSDGLMEAYVTLEEMPASKKVR